MGTKEQKAKEYSDNEVRRYHQHTGVIEKYGMERARMTSEHESWELEEAYEAGWDACLKYLASLPLDEAANRILYHGAKISDKSTFND